MGGASLGPHPHLIRESKIRLKQFIDDTDQGCDGDGVQERDVCLKALLDVPMRTVQNIEGLY